MKLTKFQWVIAIIWVLICLVAYFAIYRAVGGSQAVSKAIEGAKADLGLISDLQKIKDVNGAGVKSVTTWVNGQGNTSLIVTVFIDDSCAKDKARCEQILSEAASTTINTLKNLKDDEELVVDAVNQHNYLIFSFSRDYPVAKAVGSWKTDPIATISE